MSEKEKDFTIKNVTPLVTSIIGVIIIGTNGTNMPFVIADLATYSYNRIRRLKDTLINEVGEGNVPLSTRHVIDVFFNRFIKYSLGRLLILGSHIIYFCPLTFQHHRQNK